MKANSVKEPEILFSRITTVKQIISLTNRNLLGFDLDPTYHGLLL